MESTDADASVPSVESEEAWKLILSHIPVVERLSSCSLVSSTLRRAAAALLAQCTTLKTRLRSKHYQPFTDWLRIYSGQLAVLDITGPWCDWTKIDLLQLPCLQLQQLVVTNCQLASAPSLPQQQPQQGPQSTLAHESLQSLSSVMSLDAEPTTTRPAALLIFTGLTQLCLKHVKISTDEDSPPSAAAAAAAGSNSGDVGAETVLQLLGQLTNLKELDLDCCYGIWPDSLEAYTALTASSYLVKLKIDQSRLPAGIWEFALRQDAPLLHLTHLSYKDDNCSSVYDPEQDEFSDAAYMDTADIGRVASYCPALQQLEVGLQPGAQLNALSQLTGLTLFGAYALGESNIESLVPVTQLRDLSIYLRNGTPGGQYALEPLTALKQLTHLFCDDTGSHEYLDWSDAEFCNHAAEGAPPNVWQQLKEHIEPPLDVDYLGWEEEEIF